MDDFDDPDNPLDIDGDGDDALDMCLFFDDDKEATTEKTGCSIVFLLLGTSISACGVGIVKLFDLNLFS